MRGKMLKILLLFLLIIIGTAGFYFYNTNQTSKQKIETLKKENKQLKQNETEAAKTTEQLSEQMDTLYTEKNGTANETLTNATRELFSSVFDYCTERKDDSVKIRKDKALKLATEKAVDGLFPKDAASSTATVQTTSHLKGDPEVYLMPSNEKILTALVVVHYSVSIAGSDEQPGTFMYKITFDSTENLFTSVENAGVVNVQ